MAFRGGKRKDVKKQSYYVWFLGAKESKGLRGEEYIRPVLRNLVDKERDVEPTKVTLQVSTKGIKIIQVVPRKGGAKGSSKTEQIKHFIPHHAITCAMQESQRPNDDIVCCILLLYNPLTRCPVHVHAYRCDSVETATALRSQLQVLIERPENQKKFREIENRLAAKGLLPTTRTLNNSDGRSTRTDGSDRTEDSSGGSSGGEVGGGRKEHIAHLYDSLAAELRERLSNRDSCPILLPPRDYDTVCRRQGRLMDIGSRRATHDRLVGKPPASPPAHKPDSASNRSSSGIGSDEALSSAIQEVSSHPDFGSKEIDPETSSEDEEEDWLPDGPLPDEGDEIGDDDEEEAVVVPSYEWRRPHRYAPANGARERRSRSSPDDEDSSDQRFNRAPRNVRGIVDKFERRTTSPPLPPDNGRAPNVRQPPQPDRQFDVVYRRHSNPLDKKPQRDPRPVSYPAADPVPTRPAKSRQEGPAPKYKEAYPPQDHVPVQRFPPANFDRYVDRHTPRDIAYVRDSPVRQFRSPDMYSRQRQVSATDVRQERGAFPSRYVEPYPDSRPTYHPSEERRRSGYFDLPVDPRDYRHSFVESPFRRLPLNTQY